MYIHGGMFVNGSEEAFEFVGKTFVEAGYIFAPIGFRQLTKYNFFDSLADMDAGFKKCIEVVPEYGGSDTDVTIISWSGGYTAVGPNLYQHRDFYAKHVKMVVALGAPFKLDGFEKKIQSSLFDHYHEVHSCYMYNNIHQDPLPQRFEFVVGCKLLEFPAIYGQNHVWPEIFRDIGYDSHMFELEYHDHYDLSLNTEFSLSRIREMEVREIKPDNEVSRALFLDGFEHKSSLITFLSSDLWKPLFRPSPDLAYRVFAESISRLNSDSLQNCPLSHFQFYESAVALQPSAMGLLITHNSACQAAWSFGGAYHQKLIKDSEQRKRPVTVALDEFGCESLPREIGTTAILDLKTKQFILDCIVPYHRKYWVDGLGKEPCADLALVFAKMVANPKTAASEGVNAFLVAVRNP